MLMFGFPPLCSYLFILLIFQLKNCFRELLQSINTLNASVMHFTTEMKRQRRQKAEETSIQAPVSMESIVSCLADCAKIFVNDFYYLLYQVHGDIYFHKVSGDRPSRYALNLAKKVLSEEVLKQYRLSPQKAGDSSRPDFPPEYDEVVEKIKCKLS
jgi:hypothetical protein